ncbi:uncharacterized protein BDZ99DRAFT_542519 [Mytilinidion resinicola]|uniref:Uncharacterized protein n=1 Tax=Mytilinidion resinicola TaxID=574789 RepID=A0A6A6Z7D5_9PEZI|nr:uncharacterized protein BDZ99DRAFT_542519 [Mytilinidion resinicola]KAF2816214.1 hypothetical protein BDZ99DRAFT_542519 [Mytilinidion resinicola]
MPSHSKTLQTEYQTTVPSTQNHGFQVRARSERDQALQKDNPAYPKHDLYTTSGKHELSSRSTPRIQHSYIPPPPEMDSFTQRTGDKYGTQVVTPAYTSYVTMKPASPSPQRPTTRDVHKLEAQVLAREQYVQFARNKMQLLNERDRMRNVQAEIERKFQATHAFRPRVAPMIPPGFTAQDRDDEAAIARSFHSTRTSHPRIAPVIHPGFTAQDRDVEAAMRRRFYQFAAMRKGRHQLRDFPPIERATLPSVHQRCDVPSSTPAQNPKPDTEIDRPVNGVFPRNGIYPLPKLHTEADQPFNGIYLKNGMYPLPPPVCRPRKLSGSTKQADMIDEKSNVRKSRVPKSNQSPYLPRVRPRKTAIAELANNEDQVDDEKYESIMAWVMEIKEAMEPEEQENVVNCSMCYPYESCVCPPPLMPDNEDEDDKDEDETSSQVSIDTVVHTPDKNVIGPDTFPPVSPTWRLPVW